jgi:hypothetical protein
MRVLLDACVLFPTVMREMLLGAAAAGGYDPLWSPRILEEWARATRRLPEGSEAIARAEIAALRARWPEARDRPAPGSRRNPVAARCRRPPRARRRHRRRGGCDPHAEPRRLPAARARPPRPALRLPDEFLLDLWSSGLDLPAVAEAVRARTEAVSGRPQATPPAPETRRPAAPRQGAGGLSWTPAYRPIPAPVVSLGSRRQADLSRRDPGREGQRPTRRA